MVQRFESGRWRSHAPALPSLRNCTGEVVQFLSHHGAGRPPSVKPGETDIVDIRAASPRVRRTARHGLALLERAFDTPRVTSALAVDSPADVSAALAEAVRRAGRIAPGAAPDLVASSVRARPALPVDPAFSPVLPQGLRRGTSVGVAGGVASTSLTLALVGAASAAGSSPTLWPRLSDL